MSLSIPTKIEIESYQTLAKIVGSNPHWRQLGGETKERKLSDDEITSNILCVMLLAREIGLPPMQAIAYGIYNIKGKFEISARGMNQLIRQRGHQLKIKTLNHEICVIWGKRNDTGEEMECTYHIQEAVRAGLVKDFGGWAKNPQDMVFARAISRLSRRLFADCIGGFYVEGEIKESALKQTVEGIELPPLDAIEVIPTVETPVQLAFPLPEDISMEEVNIFIDECASTSGKSRDIVIKAANQFPDTFVSKLRKWEDARVPQVEVKSMDEILV